MIANVVKQALQPRKVRPSLRRYANIFAKLNAKRGERVYNNRARVVLRALTDAGMKLEPVETKDRSTLFAEPDGSKWIIHTSTLIDMHVRQTSPAGEPRSYRYPGWQLNLGAKHGIIVGLFDRDAKHLLCVKRIPRRAAGRVKHSMIMLERLEMSPYKSLYSAPSLGKVMHQELMITFAPLDSKTRRK